MTKSVVQIQGHLFANLLNYRNKNISQLPEKKEERIYKIVFNIIIQTQHLLPKPDHNLPEGKVQACI